MNKLLLYISVPGLIPVCLVTGGIESPARFLYYPLLLVLARLEASHAIYTSSIAFIILYSALPFIEAGPYPAYLVGVNAISFLVMAAVSGYISEMVRQEKDQLARSADTYHGLTNALNLKVMNLQSELDSTREAYERSKDLNNNKTRFLSSISHEIRSPLSSLRSFSEILRNYEDIDADTGREFLDIINEESNRLTELTNEILDVVRIEAGKTQWHMDKVDAAEIVRMAVRTTRPLAKNKGLTLETSIPDGIAEVSGDRNRLLQVMLNLLNNAVKFTSRGGITVGIEDLGEELRVFVSDTGEGIYPAEKDKIFDEFYRIGDDLTGRPKGSGLGLSITKRIIEAHKGRIWVESRLGMGSTFFFTLSKAEELADEAPEQERVLAGRASEILVLEDDTAMRQILRDSLEARGIRTLGVNSAKTAVEMSKIRNPDLIIVGFLHDSEGLEELRTLVRIQGIPLYHVFIIIDERIGPQVAANGYLSRPLEEDNVHEVVDKLLSKRGTGVVIVSNDQEEARSLQLFVGKRGHKTTIVEDIDQMALSPLPGLIIIDKASKDETIKTVTALRSNTNTRRIPLVLVPNFVSRDVRCIGLGNADYGGRLKPLLDALKQGG